MGPTRIPVPKVGAEGPYLGSGIPCGWQEAYTSTEGNREAPTLTPKPLTLFECHGPIAGKTPSRPSTAAYEGARHTHIPALDPSTTLSVIICACSTFLVNADTLSCSRQTRDGAERRSWRGQKTFASGQTEPSVASVYHDCSKSAVAAVIEVNAGPRSEFESRPLFTTGAETVK